MTRFLLLLLVLCSFNLSAQIIDFPDPNFKDVLLNYSPAIDTNGDNEISITEALAPDRLRFDELSMNISDFTGLEYFTNLIILEVVDQQMTELVVPSSEDLVLLRVSINDNLEVLDVSQLQQSSGTISINGNANLRIIDFEIMTAADSFSVSGSPLLEEFNIPNLVTAGTLWFSSNNALSTLNAPNLVELTNSLVVSGINQLNTVSFPSLEIIAGGLRLRELPILNSADFTSLNYVGGNLELNQINIPALEFPSLNNVYGIEVLETGIVTLDFPALTSMLDESIVNQRIDLSNNSNITRFTTPLLTAIGNEIYMQTNNLLSEVDFSSLELIDGDFFIRQAAIPTLNFPALTDLNGNFRFLGIPGGSTLNLPLLADMTTRDIWLERVDVLDLSGLTGVELLRLDFGDIDHLDLSSLVYVDNMNASNNGINSIDLSSLTTAGIIGLAENDLVSLNLNALEGFTGSIAVQDNPLESLEIGQGLDHLSTLRVMNTFLDVLDLTQFRVITLFADNSTVRELLLKNGEVESNLSLAGCLELEFICGDEEDLPNIISALETDGLPGVAVSSYCTFTPGGEFYSIQGTVLFDFDSEACAIADLPSAYEAIELTSDTETRTVLTNAAGEYVLYVSEPGAYTIKPLLNYAPLFFTAPPSYTINIPDDIPDITVPFDADFCLSPNGLIEDVGIWIVPTGPARPGFDVIYDIIIKNLGNTRVDGQYSFNYDDSILDLLTTSEPTVSTSEGMLVFEYLDLEPFEIRTTTISFSLNAPTDTPPVEGGDILNYSGEILPNPDANPEDNVYEVAQTVVNAYDPNDKTCMQGESITPDEVGEFVDYRIRFENTGTAEAINIVVTDTINTSFFDIESLQVIGGSHDFETRIRGNFIEFIFEDINLPFDDANNDGYLFFRIKTLETLELGDSFSNNAAIYFDYNFPIITNDAITTIEKPLGLPDFTENSRINLYPVPAEETLKISGLDVSEIEQLRVYNLQGILVLEKEGHDEIEVGLLKKGVYFLQIQTAKGQVFKKFLKK